ncbi:hypothetical protein BD311DRAFT_777066 [Dichomitus squalens]|uniref:L domain-like protein n=1 Tax=Dichomitus squalens TaxID=114155 RepID=A0A4Q9MU02_9APHY|nr:hypothetical protein BD311DRAFT_777066 [Dichomitus squalens]
MDVDDSSDFFLTDDEADLPKPTSRPKTREELEEKMWDSAITNAIDKLIGVIDLSASSLNRGTITHIPPSVADLESFTVLPPAHSPSSAPSSPILSPTVLPPVPSSTSRPFARATTLAAPVFDVPFFRSKDGERLRGTPAARAASMQAVSQQPTAQPRRREIQMYLANNSISRLPPELFRVAALTVLSLRSNALTSIPPQIAQLTALKELNLSQNRLRWLPSEMLSMHLTELTVSGNPWIAAPPLPPQQTPSPSTKDTVARRPVSHTVVHFTIPPLAETCVRVLVTPYNSAPPATPLHLLASTSLPSASDPPSSSRHTPADPSASDAPTAPNARPLTVLEASYVLPLTDDLHYSPALLDTLRACVPAAVARPPEFDKGRHHQEGAQAKRARRDLDDPRASSPPSVRAEDDDVFAPPRADAEVTGVSLCPSPVHRAEEGSWKRGRVPVYVRHAEERWTWEDVVAGVRVGVEAGAGGGGVPVRWRGCSRGCLAFLDPPAPAPPASAQAAGEVPAIGEDEVALDLTLGGTGTGPSTDWGDEDVQMDDVQAETLQFAGGLADPEDFEEGF